jgi:ribosomal protein L24
MRSLSATVENVDTAEAEVVIETITITDIIETDRAPAPAIPVIDHALAIAIATTEADDPARRTLLTKKTCPTNFAKSSTLRAHNTERRTNAASWTA